MAQRTDPASPTDQRAHRVAKSEAAEKRHHDRRKFVFLLLLLLLPRLGELILFLTVTGAPPKPRPTKGFLLAKSHGIKGFNAALFAHFHQQAFPLWFPEPHPLSDWLMVHGGPAPFKAKGAPRSWFPPYSMFLTSTNPSTARKRWLFLLQFWNTILTRPQHAKADPTIRPLTKSEWRDITSWADFEKSWPRGDEMKYSLLEDNYWSCGHEKFFGVVTTKLALDAYRNGQPCPIHAERLNCGHSALAADLGDTKFKSWLVIKLAEAHLVHDLALIDPVLSEEMEGYGRIPVIEMGPITVQFDGVQGRRKRVDTVMDIVYFQGGVNRGWERTSLVEYRLWVGHLAEFFVPLWRAHPTMHKMSLLGWAPERIQEAVARCFASLDEARCCVQAMILFWLQVLISDHGHLPVPFYCNPKWSQSERVCGQCLIRK